MLKSLTQPSVTPAPRTFLVEYAGEGGPDSGPRPEGACGPYNTHGMECGVVGPEMTRVPPIYTGNPVCSCEDAHNNTYRCLRAIEDHTSNFIYCEFYHSFWKDVGADNTRSLPHSESSHTLLPSFPPLPPSFHAEYYSISSDPWQLNNSITALPLQRVQKLHSMLMSMSTCSGVSCHSTDSNYSN